MVKHLFRTLTLPLLLLAGCDVGKTAQQLGAEKVMVGTLLATPAVNVSGQALLGVDGGNLDAGSLTVPGSVSGWAFLGTRKSQSLDIAPDPLSDAQVFIEGGGTRVELPPSGDGIYTRTSAAGEDGGLQYASGGSYRFEATLSGTAYAGKVDPAPLLESIPAFHPAQGYLDLEANSAFSFTRPAPPAGQERNLGFLTVFPLDAQGSRGAPTYSNAPTDPVAMLKLMISPADFKQSAVTIPGSAFPQANATYLVVFQAMKTGGPDSENLFAGSLMLVGTADVAVIRTH